MAFPTPPGPGDNPTTADVLVLGGGPAGLWAARRLARRGLTVRLLEAGPRLGGMSASIEVSGQSVDLGSHRLHPAAPTELLAELRALLGGDLQTRPRNGRIRLAGRWVAFPLRFTDLMRSLPPELTARLIADSLSGPTRRTSAGDDFGSVVHAGLGPTVGRIFYEPYAEKLWGVRASDLSGEVARRRVAASSPLDVLRRLGRARRPEGRTFLYPRHGFGQITTAVADDARSVGATLLPCHRVSRIRPGPVPTVESASPTRTVVDTAPVVLSTLPLPALAQLTSPVPPPQVGVAARALTTRSVILVYLTLDTGTWTEFDAHYLPELSTPVARISESKRYRDGPDPHDRTVICAEIPCTKGDQIWAATVDDLATIVIDTIAALDLSAPRVLAADVHRLPSVYPVLTNDSIAHLDTLQAWADRLDGVLTLGRQGRFVQDNLHHVLAMADAAADCVTDSLTIDRDRWRSACLRFASHVVED